MGADEYPRVTTILGVIRKPFLEKWRGRIGNEEADRIAREATELGTLVHAGCADIGRGLLVADVLAGVPAGLARRLVGEFAGWLEVAIRAVVVVEEPVVSDCWQFRGTPDLVAI